MMKQRIKFPKKERRELECEFERKLEENNDYWDKELNNKRVIIKRLEDTNNALFNQYIDLERKYEDSKFDPIKWESLHIRNGRFHNARASIRVSNDELMYYKDPEWVKDEVAGCLVEQLKPHMTFKRFNDSGNPYATIITAELVVGVVDKNE